MNAKGLLILVTGLLSVLSAHAQRTVTQDDVDAAKAYLSRRSSTQTGDVPSSKSVKLPIRKGPMANRGYFYVSVEGGGIYLPKSNIQLTEKISGLRLTANSKAEFDTEAWGGLRLGYDVWRDAGWALAMEGDFHYFQTKLTANNIENFGWLSLNGKADLEFYDFGFNLIAKRDLARWCQLYIGPGALVSHLKVDNGKLDINGFDVLWGGNESTTQVGVQGIAGLRFFVAKDWSIQLEYRFARITDYELNFSLIDATMDRTSHVGSLGVAYHF